MINQILKLKTRVFFRHLPDAFGQTEPEHPMGISIDLKKRSPPARTYVHECLHLIFPEKSEREIIRLEREVWNAATPKQKFHLYKRVFNRRYRHQR